MKWIHDSAAASAKRTEIRHSASGTRWRVLCWKWLLTSLCTSQMLIACEKRFKLTSQLVSFWAYPEVSLPTFEKCDAAEARAHLFSEILLLRSDQSPPVPGSPPPGASRGLFGAEKNKKKNLLKFNTSFFRPHLAQFLVFVRIFFRSLLRSRCFPHPGASWCRI